MEQSGDVNVSVSASQQIHVVDVCGDSERVDPTAKILTQRDNTTQESQKETEEMTSPKEASNEQEAASIDSDDDDEVCPLLVPITAIADGRDEEGRTPLHVACMKHKYGDINFLLKNNADVNALDHINLPPLYYYMECTDFSVHLDSVVLYTLKQLLEHGAGTVYDQPEVCKTPFHQLACRIPEGETSWNFTDEVKLLSQFCSINTQDDEGNTPLMLACKVGNIAVVKEFLYDVRLLAKSQKNNEGLQAIHIAAEEGFLEIIDLLLEAGVSVSAMDDKGKTPLHCAVKSQHPSAVSVLLDAGAIVDGMIQIDLVGSDYVDVPTPLMGAAENGDAQMMLHLLRRGASPNAIMVNGTVSTFHLCSDPKLYFILLGAGAAIPKADDLHGYAFLHLACSFQESDLSLAKIALTHQEDSITAVTKTGYTPLHVAALNGNVDILNYLTMQGADINAKDNSGKIPLSLAAIQGHEDVISELLKVGAHPGICDNHGLTPLHHACTATLECVQPLLKSAKSCLNDLAWRRKLSAATMDSYPEEHKFNGPDSTDSEFEESFEELWGIQQTSSAMSKDISEIETQICETHEVKNAELERTVTNFITVLLQTVVAKLEQNHGNGHPCSSQLVKCPKLPRDDEQVAANDIDDHDSDGVSKGNDQLKREISQNQTKADQGCMSDKDLPSNSSSEFILTETDTDMEEPISIDTEPISSSSAESHQTDEAFTTGAPIHAAVIFRHADIVKALIEAGCDINIVDSMGSTPLMVAFCVGAADCIEILLEQEDIDLTAGNLDNWSHLIDNSTNQSGNNASLSKLLKLWLSINSEQSDVRTITVPLM